MRIPRIDEPIRLSAPFWSTYILSVAAYSWFTRPWAWDYPVWYRVLGATLIPFLAALAIYCVILFFVSLATDFREQTHTVSAVVFSICLAGVFMAYAWTRAGFRDLPGSVEFIAAFLANGLYSYLKHRGVKRDVSASARNSDRQTRT